MADRQPDSDRITELSSSGLLQDARSDGVLIGAATLG
jgi:hypothetical protein